MHPRRHLVFDVFVITGVKVISDTIYRYFTSFMASVVTFGSFLGSKYAIFNLLAVIFSKPALLLLKVIYDENLVSYQFFP